MAKITFIILAHENARHVAELARLLTGWSEDAHAVIHYDLKSSAAEFAKLKSEFSGSSRVHFVNDRIKCGWGDFTLIDAVVRCLRLIRKERIDCERVMLMSGACMPIRPLREFSAYLDAHPHTEFIESFDSDWIVGGLRKERYQYWHFFNHQTQHTLFNFHYKIQRKIWPKRKFPKGLEPRFGSQWWCLSWELCEKILDYIASRPLVYFFFSTTWIPDELFFQTMAFHFTPINNLARRTLTFFHFNDWGKPLVFLDDHRDLLKEVPYFFARKIGSRADKLREDLKAIALGPIPEKPVEIDLTSRYVFPYKKMLRDLPKAEPSASPALFQHRHKSGWSDVLEKCSKSFGILYGPPQLTRRALAVLANVEGLTAFGRILNPETVDFGSGVTAFKGLQSDDNRIRDMDIPYYFGRLLSRCEKLPVFELCPGDDPASEIALLQSENAIVMPITPGNDAEIMQQLYWILCSRPQIESTVVADTPIATFRSMLKGVDRSISKDFRDRTETFLGTARMSKATTLAQWRSGLEFRHGKAVIPLANAFEDALGAVRATSIEDIMVGMPEKWRQTISTLADYDPNWKILRLNVPVELPELWTTSMQLQALALSKLGKGNAA
ncbi:MAG: Core-2/I-branching enzyme [Rhizobium sp.]|nr:Core-2/I-branching enzyme [Rhizobium sp.]